MIVIPFERTMGIHSSMSTHQYLEKETWIRMAMEKFEAPLLKYALGITRDIDRARDVVQDTFLKLCSQDPSKVDGYLSKWLYTVCRNRAFDVQKKEARTRPMTELESELQQSEDATPAEIVERKDLSENAMKVLGKLPANQQEVLRLKFQHGLSYQEISDITQLTVTNVGFLIHTAIKNIREKLPPELKQEFCKT